MVTFADGVTPLQELHSHLNGYCGEHEDLNACLNRVRALVEELMPLEPPEQEPPSMPSDEYLARAAKILAPVFVANEWTWRRNADDAVPGEMEIETNLRDLAKTVIDDKAEWATSGRLVARIFNWSDRIKPDVRLGLEIVE